jgi:G3E family GTPase
MQHGGVMSIPVYIISGFLGSGKTTLLNHILKSFPKDVKVAILVNEFGDISIDGRIITHEGYLVSEITNGCICCTLRYELTRGIIDIVHDYKPDVMIIETTGLSIPSDIAGDLRVEQLKDRVSCQGIVIVVNAPKYLLLEKKFMAVNAQMKDAASVVLNKMDLMNEKDLDEVKKRINEVKPENALVFETSFGEIEYSKIFPEIKAKSIEEITHNHESGGHAYHEHDDHEHEHRDSTSGFKSYAFVENTIMSYKKIVDFFADNLEIIVRAKGTVKTDEGNKLFQFSSNGLDISDYGQNITKSELVFILEEKDEEYFKKELELELR